MPTILCQLLCGCASLRPGRLEPERDLTFVTDTVAGMLALGVCDAAVGRTVNLVRRGVLGGRPGTSKCMAVVGREVPIETEAVRVRPAASEVAAR